MTQRGRVASRAAIFGFALAASAQTAQAHLVTTGVGPIYDGVAHFALSPEQFVPVAGAALLAGLGGKGQARLAVVLLPIAWLIAGILGVLPGAPAWAAPPWTPFLVIGGLVAADLKLPVGATGALVGSLALALGYPNGVAMAADGQGARGVIGSAAAVFVLATLAAALAAGTTVAWIRIAWRVLGSWTAATGILLFGWSLR